MTTNSQGSLAGRIAEMTRLMRELREGLSWFEPGSLSARDVELLSDQLDQTIEGVRNLLTMIGVPIPPIRREYEEEGRAMPEAIATPIGEIDGDEEA